MTEPKEWYSMIEDILQCPVCLTIGETSYIHCLRGHHMCAYCIQSVTRCPICNDYLLPKSIKHLVADDLASKLSVIQLSIDEDIKSSNTKSQKDQSVQTDLLITNSSVHVQTDETNHLEHELPNIYTRMLSVESNKLPYYWDHVLLIDNKVVFFVSINVHSEDGFKCSVRYIKVEPLLPILNYKITVPTYREMKYIGEVRPYEAGHYEDFDVCFNAETMYSLLQNQSFIFIFSLNCINPDTDPLLENAYF